MRLSILNGALVLGVAAAWLLWGNNPSQSQVPPELQPELRDRNVMKFKLYHAQQILEGLATENFKVLETNAAQLAQLTREVSWRIRQTPEYDRLSGDFRKHAQALAKAARAESVDGATVAYFQLTVSCVSCHKYLRGRDVLGAIPAPGAGERAWETSLVLALP